MTSWHYIKWMYECELWAVSHECMAAFNEQMGKNISEKSISKQQIDNKMGERRQMARCKWIWKKHDCHWIEWVVFAQLLLWNSRNASSFCLKNATIAVHRQHHLHYSDGFIGWCDGDSGEWRTATIFNLPLDKWYSNWEDAGRWKSQRTCECVLVLFSSDCKWMEWINS